MESESETRDTRELQEILVLVKSMNERMCKIEKDVELLKDGKDRMDEHISFIESVYTTVQRPFYKIMSLASRMIDNDKDNNSSIQKIQ